jgi:hypothetical protein
VGQKWWYGNSEGSGWQSIWSSLFVPNNDSPPAWSCPATHDPGSPSWGILPCGWKGLLSPPG